MKTILVDCSNTYSGGAKTHLREIFSRVSLGPMDLVYTFVGAREILSGIPDADKRFSKITPASLSGPSIQRHLWRIFLLPRLVKRFDLVFYPGGTVIGNPKKSVTMCRNMLPFMREEYLRYGFSLYTVKFEVLRWLQRRSYRSADGVIFLSDYALEAIEIECDLSGRRESKSHAMIPHGVNESFRVKPIIGATEFPKNRDQTRLLYISGLDVYKNQDVVLEAVNLVRNNGVNLEISFVGGANRVARRRFLRKRKSLDPNGSWSSLPGEVAHERLHEFYDNADIFVYASSCENLPNILLEAMARGLPIICSNKRPMVDVLGEGGVYFDPKDSDSLAAAISATVESRELRNRIQTIAYERANEYNWDACANKTFKYLHQIACS